MRVDTLGLVHTGWGTRSWVGAGREEWACLRIGARGFVDVSLAVI